MISYPTIALIDDDSEALASLACFLTTAGLTVRSYSSATDLLSDTVLEHDSCIVSDVRMPYMSGIELVKAVQGLKHQIILITGHADVAMAVEAMKLGAFDFIEKPFDPQVLLSAIHRALLPRHEFDVHSRSLINTLSGREQDVLRGIVVGGTTKAIASQLRISPRTVEVYRANIMKKLRVHGVAQLTRMGLSAGMDGEEQQGGWDIATAPAEWDSSS